MREGQGSGVRSQVPYSSGFRCRGLTSATAWGSGESSNVTEVPVKGPLS
jgi:hypothetical protein